MDVDLDVNVNVNASSIDDTIGDTIGDTIERGSGALHTGPTSARDLARFAPPGRGTRGSRSPRAGVSRGARLPRHVDLDLDARPSRES